MSLEGRATFWVVAGTLWLGLASLRAEESFRQEIAHRYTTADGLWSDDVQHVAIENGAVWVWTAEGAASMSASGVWERGQRDRPPVSPLPEGQPVESGRTWVRDAFTAGAIDSEGKRWFAGPAGLVVEEEAGWRLLDGKDGLPHNGFTCAAAGPDGEVWFGTDRGLIRYENGEFAYRQGPRWLPDDHVRALAVDQDGSVWVATGKGLGRIERRSMTLQEKAEHYEAEIESHIKRTPYGYTSPVRLGAPGDRDSDVSRHDNDNDGLWTSMYGASQCYAFAVHGMEVYRQRARQAFRALRFLQQVPQTGELKPPHGYVARTIRSAALPDPNNGRLERDQRFQKEEDSLWKVYEPRWPRSGDGKWYWKSDTSSDELDGHYFFYGLYYDLVAKTEDERESVREVVGALTDHLILHGFTLTDHDGKPTRWGRFDPPALNRDPDWQVERGLNSLSMLSYLAVAHHVTGEQRYADTATELRERHHYDTNAMVPKIQLGAGSGNQSDDEMAFMGFYQLIRYTKDEALRAQFVGAFHQYWLLEKAERNPFFHFAYAAVGKGQTKRTPWQLHDLSPAGDWLKDSLATLRGFPLDRVNWPLQNRHRLDLVKLPSIASRGLISEDAQWRGHRVDGKVLPVEERHFNHWNTDPWQIDYGGDGRTLACGTVFLLPYHMGRYHGFIE